MSLDIFVSTLTEDEGAKFDRAIVERAFRAIAVDQQGDSWNLQTPKGEMTSATIHLAYQPRILSFAANRPPSYEYFPEFWDAMFEVMRQTHTVLVWLADGPKPHCCVANPAMIPDLPSDLIEALGQPAFATSGAEIGAVLERSFS
ncbi:MAG: hypothetical protein WB677_16690 [Xanthobacteraceae bacterium]